MSEGDGIDLIKEAKVERLSHEAKSQQTTTESDDAEDSSWSYDLNYSVGMNNKSITSIGLNFGCQVGGAVTGHSYFVGCTYNNKTGTKLSLNDILLGDYDSKLRVLFVKYLTPISDQLSSEWKTSIQDVGFEFYISSKGIVFVFPKYSIGPGFMATIDVEIPFKEFQGIVDPKSPLAPYIKK